MATHGGGFRSAWQGEVDGTSNRLLPAQKAASPSRSHVAQRLGPKQRDLWLSSPSAPAAPLPQIVLARGARSFAGCREEAGCGSSGARSMPRRSCRRPRQEEIPALQAFRSGRYWTRTTDSEPVAAGSRAVLHSRARCIPAAHAVPRSDTRLPLRTRAAHLTFALEPKERRKPCVSRAFV